MGCGGSKQFEVAVIASPSTAFTAEQCVTGVASPSETTTVVCKAQGMSGSAIMEGDSTIFTGKVISTINKEGAMEDTAGKRIVVSKTKTTKLVPMDTETRYLRLSPAFEGQKSEDFASDDKDKMSPLYNFAMVTAKHRAGAEGTFSVYTSDGTTTLLTATRFAGIKQATLVYDSSGTCVAKSKVTDTFGKEVTIEIAGGVDKLAVLALVSQLAPGGGGANAGSGTGAYGG